MLKTMCAIGICILAFVAVGQAASKYQVGTITEVKVHKPAVDGVSEAASYEVSLKVGDTVYLLIYAPPLGMNTVKYSAGRDVLVLVGIPLSMVVVGKLLSKLNRVYGDVTNTTPAFSRSA